MKVYRTNKAVINLEQVQHISTRQLDDDEVVIWFHFKNTGESVSTTVTNNQVNPILQECYELMKKED